MRATTLLFAGLASLGVVGLLVEHARVSSGASAVTSASPRPPEPTHAARPDGGSDEPLACGVRARAAPAGRPAMLSCREARQVVAQVRGRLALPRPSADRAAFAEWVVDWLDPHGLWSAAPDAPTAARIAELAPQLIEEIERAPSAADDCGVALALGAEVGAWVRRLRGVYVQAQKAAPELPPRAAFRMAAEPVFRDEPLGPAERLSAELGRRVGAFARGFSHISPVFASAATERFVPELRDSEWQRAVLAAAIRAYVPSIDPHGQWAPLDEETSLYADDVDLGLGPRLWDRMARSALGVQVLEGALPPLAQGDLVLAIDGVPTAGLSVEQVEQLAWLDTLSDDAARKVAVLRAGQSQERELRIELPPESADEVEHLRSERVRYGEGYALALTVPDVSDALGDQIADAIRDARRAGPLVGVVLDLRGNGGGSTDGAAAAIGVFMPGVPSFPLLLRGGEVEVEHALVPADGSAWNGPVAAIVDGYTASAAEMIAGALAAYARGVVLGTRTFGKGCIQEYFDDRAGAGVLRLTTMLFALPDGSPLQGIGLTPSVQLPLMAVREREATLGASLPPWRGPDVRAPLPTSSMSWPAHEGRVGRCHDRTVCLALRRLGRSTRMSTPNRVAQETGANRHAATR